VHVFCWREYSAFMGPTVSQGVVEGTLAHLCRRYSRMYDFDRVLTGLVWPQKATLLFGISYCDRSSEPSMFHTGDIAGVELQAILLTLCWHTITTIGVMVPKGELVSQL
jgi:hypothetical protein